MSGGWFRAAWLVAARELREGSRARSFRIVTLLLVLAVAAAVVIPAAMRGHHRIEKVGIVGGAEPAATDTVQTAARIAGVEVRTVRLANLGAAETQLRAGTLAAVLVAGHEVLVKQAPAPGTTAAGSSLSGALALAGGLARLSGAVPAGALSHGLSLPIRGLKPPLTDLSVRLTGLAMTLVVYMIILLYGSRITVGVSEEKASRVVEVLLAAVRPSQLLAGKVLGLGILAFAQALAIVVTFVVLGALVGSSLIHSASLEVVAVGALWVVAGYAFYCTAYAAAGSLVSKPSDAYNASLPVQLPLILSYILTFTVLYGSGVGALFWFLAFFPPTAPISMTVLVAIGVARPWEVALSLLLCVAATVGMARIAGAIYGRAILHSGARLKWRQALRRSPS
jgi:ABC-2 type transport system permease protein